MKAWIGSVAVLAAALALSGCASRGGTAAEAPQRDCFSSGRVSGFTPSMICTSDAMGWEIVVLDRPGIGPDSCRVRAIRKLESEVRVQP